ncbi:hypothetical protein HK101_000445 [Irineochytrium annulatum]|nr:hypothetical protein HK101_000445 [Irineochytrium annulatum]
MAVTTAAAPALGANGPGPGQSDASPIAALKALLEDPANLAPDRAASTRETVSKLLNLHRAGTSPSSSSGPVAAPPPADQKAHRLPPTLLPAVAALNHVDCLTHMLPAASTESPSHVAAALMAACAAGSLDCARVVLYPPSPLPSSSPSRSSTAPPWERPSETSIAMSLQAALRGGHLALVRYLIEILSTEPPPAGTGSRTNRRSTSGTVDSRSALDGIVGIEHVTHAAWRGDVSTLEFVLLHRPRARFAGDHQAASVVSEVPELAGGAEGAEPRMGGAEWRNTALVLASKGGSVECVRCLLMVGADAGWRMGLAVAVAEREGKGEVVKILRNEVSRRGVCLNGAGGCFAGIFGGKRRRRRVLSTAAGVVSPPTSPISPSSESRPVTAAEQASPITSEPLVIPTASKDDAKAVVDTVTVEPIAEQAAPMPVPISVVIPGVAAASKPRPASEQLPGQVHTLPEASKSADQLKDHGKSAKEGMLVAKKVPQEKSASGNGAVAAGGDQAAVVVGSVEKVGVTSERQSYIRDSVADRQGARTTTEEEKRHSKVTITVSIPAAPPFFDHPGVINDGVPAPPHPTDAHATPVNRLSSTGKQFVSSSHDLDPNEIEKRILNTILKFNAKSLELLETMSPTRQSLSHLASQSRIVTSLPKNVILRVLDYVTDSHDIFHFCGASRILYGDRAIYHARLLVRNPPSDRPTQGAASVTMAPTTPTSTTSSNVVANVTAAVRLILTRPPSHMQDGASHPIRMLDHVLASLNPGASASAGVPLQPTPSLNPSFSPLVSSPLRPSPGGALASATAGVGSMIPPLMSKQHSAAMNFRANRAGMVGAPTSARRLGPKAVEPLLELALQHGAVSWALPRILEAGSTTKASMARLIGACCAKGEAGAVGSLLLAGADADAHVGPELGGRVSVAGGKVEEDEVTCLAAAACGGHEACIVALLEGGADAGAGDSVALRLGAGSRSCSVGVLTRLIGAGAEVSARSYEAVRRAAARGDAACLKCLVGGTLGLVRSRWEVRAAIKVAYETASKGGHVGAVRALLAERATWSWGHGLDSPAIVLRNAVVAAVEGGHVDVVRAFGESEAWSDLVVGDDAKGLLEAALKPLGDGALSGGAERGSLGSLLLTPEALNGLTRSLSQRSRVDAKATASAPMQASEKAVADRSIDEEDVGPKAEAVANMVEAILGCVHHHGRAQYPTMFYGGEEAATTRVKVDPWEMIRASPELRRLRSLLLVRAAAVGSEAVLEAVLATLQPEVAGTAVGRRALRAAVEGGHVKVVARLISAGAEFEGNDDGVDVFEVAKGLTSQSVLELLKLSRDLRKKQEERRAKLRELRDHATVVI